MIEVLSQNVEKPELDWEKVERWIVEVAQRLGRRVGALTYIFCDDERILEVNRQFLNHDYYTDIITFDNTTGRLIRGDMFISLDTVATNADSVEATYDEELMRVIIHGVLHLCGINDKGPGEREIMEAHENEALKLWREAYVSHKDI
ncbi:MAG: rRNA maturation RNase YbeY [Muribaculaceae bacterium]|nr:rRNA maturation RNase YbeY [Muribaculaceae bacterium]